MQIASDQFEVFRSQAQSNSLPAGHQLTVMMFGLTGSGKSSLGNLIAGSEIFNTSNNTVSATNLDSLKSYEASDGSLVVLDTIGLGDTELEQDKVAASIRDVALSAPNGIDILLYVMRNNRICDGALARLIYVMQYLWGDESLLNLYVVVTHASQYVQNRKEAEEFIHKQAEADWRFHHIFTMVGNNPDRFIFVDNPALDSGEPEVQRRRASSRKELFRAFCSHPRDTVPPFTASMMKKVQQLVKDERSQLDEKQQAVARLQKAIDKQPSSDLDASDAEKSDGVQLLKTENTVPDERTTKHESSQKQKEKKTDKKEKSKDKEKNEKKDKKEKDKKSTKDKETLKLRLNQAELEVAQAKKAMEEKLESVKKDKEFQKEAAEQAAKATVKFQADFQAPDATSRRSNFFGTSLRLFGGVGSQKAAMAEPAQKRMFGLLSRSAAKVEQQVEAGTVCIIFDWDDTLVPTHWFGTVMRPSLVRVPFSAYHEALAAHALLVEETLRTAKQVGIVDIVTMANKEWLDMTIGYLKVGGVDLAALLQELDIKVYFAEVPDVAPDGGDRSVCAKKVCMTELINNRYKGQTRAQWNVTSIGDQETEAIALRQVCKDNQKKLWRKPVCKTVLLPKEPMIDDLGRTLQILIPQLGSLVKKADDLDTSVALMQKLLGT